jgi:hypothetical protein
MPPDAVNHIIKETGAKAIFTEVMNQLTRLSSFIDINLHLDISVWHFKQGIQRARERKSAKIRLLRW